MTRPTAAFVPEARPTGRSRQRIVIGRTHAGLPRTYRLVRRGNPWPARLMAALSSVTSLL